MCLLDEAHSMLQNDIGLFMNCWTKRPPGLARSRIAFKLVWAPPDFNSFVLVDDGGDLDIVHP